MGSLVGNKIYFDTNIFIYSIEREETKEIFRDFFTSIVNKVSSIITSELTIAECLVKPKRENNKELENMYLDILIENQNIHLQKVDIATWILASDVRAKYNFKIPDSIHIATALLNDCIFITNDKALHNKYIEGLDVFSLDDFLE